MDRRRYLTILVFLTLSEMLHWQIRSQQKGPCGLAELNRSSAVPANMPPNDRSPEIVLTTTTATTTETTTTTTTTTTSTTISPMVWGSALVGTVTDKDHPAEIAESCAPVKGNKQMYRSSMFEMEWTTKQAGQLCNTAWTQRHDAALWLNYSKSVWMSDGIAAARPPSKEEEQVLSKFLRDGSEPSFIEPLSGMARHPLSFYGVGCAAYIGQAMDPSYAHRDIFDISYLIVENFCGKPRPMTRARFFDLGCTVFSDGTGSLTEHFDYSKGSGSGPSIPLFYNLYKDRCIVFDDILAFEGIQYKADDWWSRVPDSIRHKIHFYNHVVSELPFKEAVSGGRYSQGGSFLNMLRVVKPEDFVVVKLDIDGGPEFEIAYSICEQPDLFTRVDEIFFEYHFDFDGLDFGWGPGGGNPLHKVDHAIAVMRCLRERGIRSHFWV